MKIQIFDTQYAWNVLASINTFLDGMLFGLGFLMVFMVFVLLTKKQTKDKESQ